MFIDAYVMSRSYPESRKIMIPLAVLVVVVILRLQLLPLLQFIPITVPILSVLHQFPENVVVAAASRVMLKYALHLATDVSVSPLRQLG